jgi:DNA-binding SARP family transcriptional activator
VGERGHVQVQILGPLQVFDDGHEVDIGAASQRRLLARLAVASPETVSAERLLEDLEVSPGGLRTAISRLRKTLGDTLVTEAPGYKLTAGLDSAPFEAQLAQALQAEPAQRIALCDQALDLWRGSPLAEFADEHWAQTETTRLEELRVLAREARVQAKLDLGRHAETISELEAIIADHPYRDHPRGQLMTALAESGRRTEALRAFQAYRRLLDEENGGRVELTNGVARTFSRA